MKGTGMVCDLEVPSGQMLYGLHNHGPVIRYGCVLSACVDMYAMA